ADRENDPDVLCMIGSSAALHVSHIPFLKPTASVRLARIGSEMILLPTHSQLEESDLDLIVSGTRDAITMIEGFAREMSEENMLQAIQFAHEHIRSLVDMIEELREKAGLGKKELPPPGAANPLVEIFRQRFANEFRERKLTSGKADRADKIRELREKVFAEYLPEDKEPEYEPGQVAQAFESLEERVVRDLILEGKRIDGRNPKQLRPISCEVGVLPRTHGTAIFQRGETQALVTTTLGTTSDEQRVDGLMDEYSKKFMLDYNFRRSRSARAGPPAGRGAARLATAHSPSAA